jgi:hypothetical protein
MAPSTLLAKNVFPNAIALFSTTIMDATTFPPHFIFKFIIDGAVMLKLQKIW